MILRCLDDECLFDIDTYSYKLVSILRGKLHEAQYVAFPDLVRHFVHCVLGVRLIGAHRATLAYRNSAIYPETGKTVAQSLLGRNLRDCLPAVKGFYNLKKEHLMERKQRELVAAKRVQIMMDTYNKGAR